MLGFMVEAEIIFWVVLAHVLVKFVPVWFRGLDTEPPVKPGESDGFLS